MLAYPSKRSTREIAEELELIALRPSHDGGNVSSHTTAATPVSTPASQSQSTAVALELHALCAAAVSALPKEAAALRSGHMNVLNKLVGHVMRSSRGRADALVARQVLEEMVHTDS